MLPDSKRLLNWTAWFTKNEGRIICFFAFALLALNLATPLLYPTAWVDESMFSDPAIRYLHGQGLTSTAWWQSRAITWSGNVPLYTLALIPWFKLVGVGLVKARAFNYVIISTTLVVFWLGVRRLNLVASASMRVGLIVTAFLSYSFCFPYRTARPDCLGMLICAFGLLAWSWQNRFLSNTVLFIAGFLAPMSGLQLAAYLGFVCVLIFIVARAKPFPRLALIMAGVVIGTIALFSYYHLNHLTGVQKTIKQARLINQYAEMAGQPHQIGLTKYFLIKLHRIAADEYLDFSITPTFLALVFLAFDRRVWPVPANRQLLLLGLISGFALTSALEFFLHYLSYYHWMNYILTVTALFALLARIWAKLPGMKKAVVLSLILISLVGGMPLRLGLGIAFDQPSQYLQMEKLADEKLKPADVVFVDYADYFSAEPRVHDVMLPNYLLPMTEPERQSINVIMVPPDSVKYYLLKLKENEQEWEKTAEYIYQPGPLGRQVLRFSRHYTDQPTSSGYSVSILRRKENFSSPQQAAHF